MIRFIANLIATVIAFVFMIIMYIPIYMIGIICDGVVTIFMDAYTSSSEINDLDNEDKN